MSSRAYIGLGANLGSDEAIRARFQVVARAVSTWPEVRSVRVSRLYRSAAVGPVSDQPDYINAVLESQVSDDLDPVTLLARLRQLEHRLGRDPAVHLHQHPRPIDVDLISYGDLVIEIAGPPQVSLPHPRAHRRAFVLTPLAELAGDDFVLPGQALGIGDLLVDLLGGSELGARFGAVQEATDIAPVSVHDDQSDGDAEGDFGVAAAEDEQ